MSEMSTAQKESVWAERCIAVVRNQMKRQPEVHSVLNHFADDTQTAILRRGWQTTFARGGADARSLATKVAAALASQFPVEGAGGIDREVASTRSEPILKPFGLVARGIEQVGRRPTGQGGRTL